MAASLKQRLNLSGFPTALHPEGVQHVNTSLMTIRGLVATGWEVKSDGLHLRLKVPVGSCAHVRLPKPEDTVIQVAEGDRALRTTDGEYQIVPGIREAREEAQAVVVVVGSGEYQFTVQRVSQPNESHRVT